MGKERKRNGENEGGGGGEGGRREIRAMSGWVKQGMNGTFALQKGKRSRPSTTLMTFRLITLCCIVHYISPTITVKIGTAFQNDLWWRSKFDRGFGPLPSNELELCATRVLAAHDAPNIDHDCVEKGDEPRLRISTGQSDQVRRSPVLSTGRGPSGQDDSSQPAAAPVPL